MIEKRKGKNVSIVRHCEFWPKEFQWRQLYQKRNSFVRNWLYFDSYASIVLEYHYLRYVVVFVLHAVTMILWCDVPWFSVLLSTGLFRQFHPKNDYIEAIYHRNLWDESSFLL